MKRLAVAGFRDARRRKRWKKRLRQPETQHFWKFFLRPGTLGRRGCRFSAFRPWSQWPSPITSLSALAARPPAVSATSGCQAHYDGSRQSAGRRDSHAGGDGGPAEGPPAGSFGVAAAGLLRASGIHCSEGSVAEFCTRHSRHCTHYAAQP